MIKLSHAHYYPITGGRPRYKAVNGTAARIILNPPGNRSRVRIIFFFFSSFSDSCAEGGELSMVLLVNSLRPVSAVFRGH